MNTTATIDAAQPATGTTTLRDRPRFAGAILTSSLGAGVLTRWAFADELGLGFVIWVATLVAGFAFIGGREARQQARSAWVWAAAAVFFAAFVVIRDAPALTFFNCSASLGLLALAARDTVSPRSRTRLFDFVSSVAEVGLGATQGSFTMVSEAAVRTVELKRQAPQATGQVVRGLMLATPVVLVLGGLLVSGDSHFSSAISKLFSHSMGFETAVSWAGASLGSAVAIAGLWTYALRRNRVLTRATVAAKLKKLGTTEGLIVLGSVVLLFATFLSVQMAYLFSQDPSQKGTGLTYANYAREGFFQLTVVAALTWWLVELARRRVEAPEGSRQDLAVRVASSLVLVQALVILVSAHVRLWLYDETYGFTLMRLYAHAGIVFLGVALVVRLTTLWVLQRSSANLVFAGALAVLGGMNLLNPDAVIVKANLANETGTIDWYYLSTLSADAADALSPAFEDENGLISATGDRRDSAEMILRNWACHATPKTRSVASFNFARWHAAGFKRPCEPQYSEVDF